MGSVYSDEASREARLIAMGQMAASLAHEIRNPLGSMELFCTLLKKDLQDREASLALAEQIHLGIRKLDRIISNCLQFTRDVKPHREQITDAGPLLLEAAQYIAPRAKDLGVQVSVSAESNGIAELDRSLLSQVLVNLSLNAVEASGSRDSNPREVRLDGKISGAGTLTVIIADNGPGIPADILGHIFDPFFTTKVGGTGLGLPIVHSIVTAHRGRIGITSEGGTGTEVLIEIPAA